MNQTLELRAETPATELDLVAYCRSRLAGVKCPKRIVPHLLPKTATGKIQKGILREAVRHGEIGDLGTR